MFGINIRFLNIQKSKIIPIFFILLLLATVVSANQMTLQFSNEPKGDMVVSMRLLDPSYESVGQILVTTGSRRGEPRENGYVYLYDHKGRIIWAREISSIDNTMSSIRDTSNAANLPDIDDSDFRPYPRDAYGIDFTGSRIREILLLTTSDSYILNNQGVIQHVFDFPVRASEITWSDVFADGREVALIAGENASMIRYDGVTYEFLTVYNSSVNTVTSANIDPSVVQKEIITGGSVGENNITIHGYNSTTESWSPIATYNTGLQIKKIIAVNLETGTDYRVGDTKVEIIAISEQYVYCFHTNREDGVLEIDLLWRYPIKQGSDLIVANVIGDRTLEIIASGERVYVLDNNGNRLWESFLGTPISHVHASDLTKDGYAEIVAGSIFTYRLNRSFGELFFLDGFGNLLWKTDDYYMTEYVVIRDIDRSGVLNWILVDYNDKILGYENIIGPTNADMYFNQGLSSFDNENYRDALIYFKMAREGYEKAKNFNKVLAADSYIEKSEFFLNTGSSYERGMFYFEMGEYQKSILYFEDSKIASLSRKDFDTVLKAENMIEKATRYVEAQNYINEAEILMSEGSYSRAYSMYNNALEIYLRIGDSQKISSVERSMSKVDNYSKALDYFETGKSLFASGSYRSAKNYFERASAEFNSLGDTKGVSLSQEYIAKCDQLLESSRNVSDMDNMLLYGGIILGFLLLIVMLLFFILLK